MRVTSVFWVTTTATAAAALLLASNGIHSVESKATSSNAVRFLGAAPSVDKNSEESLESKEATARAAAEERKVEIRAEDSKSNDLKVLEDICNDNSQAEQVFSSWFRNGQSKDDIKKRLTAQDLLTKYQKVLDQYDSYCQEHVDD